MNILITGANGFLGSHITKKLADEGHTVLALSVNNNNLPCHKNIRFESFELQNVKSKRKSILSFAPDIVIHCAWIGGNAYKDANHATQFTNVIYGAEFLEILAELQDLYFICIGTMAEYGPKCVKVTEACGEQPESMYGVCKYMFNMLSKSVCKKNQFSWLWIRPSYIYGVNDVETRLIPKVIKKSLKNENIILNSCNSIADYLYIDDFVSGVHSLIKERAEGPYNVCSAQEYKIKDVLSEISKRIGSESKIIFDDSLDRENDPSYVCGDNQKICRTTGWSPQINLGDGVEQVIKLLKGEENAR